MVNFLLGQQSGHTKYLCFLCLWVSRDKTHHWVRKKWAKKKNIDIGEKNVINGPLVEREEIIFSPLHIKLGLMKRLVKASKEWIMLYIFRGGGGMPQLGMEKI